MGGSVSTASSIQTAEAYIAQNSAQKCNISCTNSLTNVNIDIINSVVGGNVSLLQSCQIDSSCMLSSSSDATSDVLFKATNSTNAKNAGNLFSGDIFNFDYASSNSRQNIKQKIVQNTAQSCKLASLNQMNNLSILVANSDIGGNLAIGQTGSVAGQCQLSNNMSAAATATALASNTAQSGKDKKGQKKGSSFILITILGFIGVMVVVYIVAKLFTSTEAQNELASETQQANIARGKAGCLGGLKPMLDSKGVVIIDPRSGRPICPPFLPGQTRSPSSLKIPTKITSPAKISSPIKK
jgi:hypothetical protein